MTEPENDNIAALAAGSLDTLDGQILAAVAELYQALDPVPTGLVDRITFGITLDALEAEVASLQRSAAEPAGVRTHGTSDVQTVTFTSSSLTTMVTIGVLSADRVRIDGWVAPGAGVSVELRTVEGSQRTVADDVGRFAFHDVPRGYVQFVLRAPGEAIGTVVLTPSIEV